MINVYDSKATVFTSNGLSALPDCTSCVISEEVNGRLELELTHPIDSRGKYKFLTGFNIIKADGQLFRIDVPENIQESENGVKIHASHVFYDNNYGFIEDRRAEGKTASEALAIALSDNPRATVGACDVTGTNTAYFVKDTPTKAVFTILDRWGGELLRDNFSVAIRNNIGVSNGVLVSYGKNITGFTQRLDFTGVATRIMPTGKDGCTIDLVNGGSKYLDSPLINNPAYPFVIIREVKFPDLDDATALKNAGLALWGTIDIPATNYTAKFIELRKTTEYASLKALETVGIGDTVIIRQKVFGVDIRAEVIAIKKDVLLDRLIEIQLGNFKDNLGKTINDQNKAIGRNSAEITVTKADLSVTKTRVTQTEQAIVLEALRIDETEGRLDSAELKITPEAITSTVTSSQEYVDDLGEKITASQASTIAQTAANVKIGFNGISDVVDIDATGIKVSHGGTDYSHMGATGFKRHTGSTDKDYHYITHQVIRPNIANGTTTSIQFPDDFKGKALYTGFGLMCWAGEIDSNANSYFIQDAVRNVFVEIVSWDSVNAVLVVRACLQKIGLSTLTMFGWNSATTTAGNPIGEGALDIYVIATM